MVLDRTFTISRVASVLIMLAVISVLPACSASGSRVSGVGSAANTQSSRGTLHQAKSQQDAEQDANPHSSLAEIPSEVKNPGPSLQNTLEE
jgi:hypothetical protein